MKFLCTLLVGLLFGNAYTQETRLLRQADISDQHIVFTYGGDVWITDIEPDITRRLTSTAAVERNPHFSPDGKWIAFTSNRMGSNSVYVVSINGGEAKRLTWHPSSSDVRGWTNDGKHVLFTSNRNTAPRPYNRLYTIPVNGGPATLVHEQWATDGSYAPNGKEIVIDKMDRWDKEWRGYRGGQNTPLIVLNLSTNKETLLENDRTTDIAPIWLGNQIYFLSDRSGVSNIWSYDPKTTDLKQLTTFTGSDVKSLSGHKNKLIFERDGYLHLLSLDSNQLTKLSITVKGDFPWAATKWTDVSRSTRSISLSPTGKRAVTEARGEIFTIPIKDGDARNISANTKAADRAPIWSPKGNEIAWFSDDGNNTGYALKITDQDGISNSRNISIGESKMAWEPTWSPDGKYIAFVDDDVRIRVIDLAKGSIETADVGGNNLERGSLGITWSPDSQWIAYAKSGTNSFKQIKVWNVKTKKINALTDPFADSFSPAWDRNKEQLYFLASTNVALGSGWANTSSMTADPSYAAYVINLKEESASPFKLKSDEEPVKKDEEEDKDKKTSKKSAAKADDDKKKDEGVTIDFDRIDRRTLALPIPVRSYRFMISGLAGTVFIGESVPNGRGLTLHKFDLKEGESKPYADGIGQLSISADGKQMLAQRNGNWQIVSTAGPDGKKGKPVQVNLQMKINKAEEWKQMFDEAWRYERDYFYDANLHGRDWQVVYERYAPLVPFVKHRDDLNYLFDQMNGELSVGHSFVGGGDFPQVDRSKVGLLGADLTIDKGQWKITKIYTTESWNPGLKSPLDQPGLSIKEGDYIVGINGTPLTAAMNPFELLDGTAGKQTILHLNDKPTFSGARKETVEPIFNENGLRQREWVESNRRLVDKLSGGKLAYVWVPNTSGGGFVDFNRYYFAQQDKLGAVIDERFNGGGLLDDYMVDLMTRSLRAGLTNEVPDGKPMRLPAGILGPKVLLINELAGSGGDFFPWVFRQQKAGLLIGARTWGGLVKSSVHYALVDGGTLTAPDNAVFDPINKKWVAENEGVPPDIAVRQDAASLAKGIDPQLERAVAELLKQLKNQGAIDMSPPAYPTPAKTRK